MNCKECKCSIFESRRYRELKEELIRLDNRFENVVNDLCMECLKLEEKKIFRKEIQKRLIQTYVKENKKYE